MELLEEIMGVDVLQADDIATLQKTDPAIFIVIISKIMDFLMYLTKIPAQLIDPNAEKDAKVNLYSTYFDKFVEEQRKKNGGEIPSWLKLVQVIFHFASD